MFGYGPNDTVKYSPISMEDYLSTIEDHGCNAHFIFAADATPEKDLLRVSDEARRLGYIEYATDPRFPTLTGTYVFPERQLFTAKRKFANT